MSGTVQLPDTRALASGIRAGERAALATALNLLDDQREASRARAGELLCDLQAQSQEPQGRLIGITGPPGAGKSSLSAALISHWRQHDLRVGVLAVDPSSPVSGGALLGDRLRMKTSAEDDGVFVRSLACRGEFGGLSAEVWPMSLVMLAAFDVTLVETVGVGQREIDISAMCDTTCFVAQPGSGDSIQFLKAGILEVPHVLVVNKEDMGAVARQTLSELAAALGREHPDGGWQVPVLSVSATRCRGIDALAEALASHRRHRLETGSLQAHRRRYQASWVIRRLPDEVGQQGLRRLGGEASLQAEMAAGTASALQDYEKYRSQLFVNS